LERRLAAILAADVVGYSRLMGEDEAGTLERLKSLRRESVQPKITEHKGRIVKLMGDGLLAEFPSVVEAVQCAVDVQREMTERESEITNDRRIRLRIGVNLGDIIVEGSDIYGDGVNVAARLEALADPGSICVSGTVFDHVKAKVDLDFVDLGEQQVKNIAEPVRVYRWTDAAADPMPGTAGAEGALPLPDKPSIAVLPFDNMSGDPEQEYFADGITEDIITELSRFPSLFVIARNSSFAFKGESVDVRQVARELGVRYVLEGSIRRAGNRVRISAQLIDRESGSHIWAERYDRNLDDIFDLQEEITRNVVGSIAPQIEMAEMDRVRGARSTKFSSYDLGLKAQALYYDAMRMGSPDVQQQAIDVTEDSLKQDPRNVHALSTQAMSYFEQYLYRWGPAPDEALDHSWTAVERIFEIDSSDPRGYAMRGVNHHFRGRFDAAVADFHRAFALNPNFAVNIFIMAWCESLAGFTDEAREHVALGLRLSPRDDELWLGVAYLALAQASFADGDFEKTKEWGKLSIQMHPKAPIRRALMIASHGYLGELEEAARHAADLKAFSPDFLPIVLRGEMTLYKAPEHNELLVDGIRKAELPE
jgi:adenylate cyclase